MLAGVVWSTELVDLGPDTSFLTAVTGLKNNTAVCCDESEEWSAAAREDNRASNLFSGLLQQQYTYIKNIM